MKHRESLAFIKNYSEGIFKDLVGAGVVDFVENKSGVLQEAIDTEKFSSRTLGARLYTLMPHARRVAQKIHEMSELAAPFESVCDERTEVVLTRESNMSDYGVRQLRNMHMFNDLITAGIAEYAMNRTGPFKVAHDEAGSTHAKSSLRGKLSTVLGDCKELRTKINMLQAPSQFL